MERGILRKFPIGAEVIPGAGVHFRVWARKRRRVALHLYRDSRHEADFELEPEGDGHFSLLVSKARTGMLYQFRLDSEDRLVADPASRFQPEGPDGPSQIVDASQFAWTDGEWPGLAPQGQVLYEIHVGTFTPDGTWQAAQRDLPRLAELGITAIQVMPVADFPGRFGWGYDGVMLFAPTRLYGRPDDLRRFIDAAHGAGLGVILDVVYNHFGPSGNPLPQFSDDFRSDRYANEWADAINFDGDNAAPVREFFEANAAYWIEEFHFDGFRFDATQAIHDSSSEHILACVSCAARRAASRRTVYLIAENEPQDVVGIRGVDQGGHGLDALLNDDFHHAARVRLTGKSQAYYSDFRGTPEEFRTVYERGFIYQGEWSQWQKKPRGTPTTGLPACCFVNFLQNHDQVANSATGERIHQLTSPGRLRAMTALWLLSPQTPLFFQGQEYAAAAPFLYFADHPGDLGRAVARGRAEFLAQFPNLGTSEGRARLHDPADPAAFERSKLSLDERRAASPAMRLHRDLLRLRRTDPLFRRQRSDLLTGAALSPDCLLVRFFGEGEDRLCLFNFGVDLHLTPAPQPLLAPPAKQTWALLWSSESPEYGGIGDAPLETDNGWHIPGEAAVVLRAVDREKERI